MVSHLPGYKSHALIHLGPQLIIIIPGSMTRSPHADRLLYLALKCFISAGIK
jgi:hypothetical protein